MSGYSELIVFVRPWDIPCLRALARDLKASGLIAGKVRYLTMWKMAADFLQESLVADEEVVFLPARLAKVELTASRRESLAQLERSLVATPGFPLKVLFSAERFRPKTSAEQMDFIWRHLAALEEQIPEGSLVVSQGVDHLCYWMACDLARSRSGAFLGFSGSGRPSGRSQGLASATELRLPHSVTEASRQEVDALRESLLAGVKPTYMHRRKSMISSAASLRYRRRLIGEIRAGNYFVHPSDVVAFSRGTKLVTKTRWRAALRAMKPKKLDTLRKPFVYFPLHLEPEAATLVYAPFMNDQSFAIDALARALPSGVALLVKENPKMWGRRPSAFYERANLSPEVVWVDPTESSQDILARCEAVITLTGTTALEAVLLDKPVTVLGAPPYLGALTSLPRVNALEQLPTMVNGLLDRSSWPSRAVLEEEYAHYIANLVPASFHGSELFDGIDMPAVPASPHFTDFALATLR